MIHFVWFIHIIWFVCMPGANHTLRLVYTHYLVRVHARGAIMGSSVTQIISFVNQKGGPGKTTLAMHLAGALARRGDRVLIADADPQGTASHWAKSAPERSPFPAAIAGLGAADATLHRELQKYLDAFRWIVVDCPPSADSPAAQSALLVSDLALIPVVPSPPDLWSSVAICAVLDRVMVLNEDLIARIVVNQRKPHTRLAAHTATLLPRYGIPVLATQVGDREAFRHAAAAGTIVHDLPRARQAAAEIEALTDEVLAILNGERNG